MNFYFCYFYFFHVVRQFRAWNFAIRIAALVNRAKIIWPELFEVWMKLFLLVFTEIFTFSILKLEMMYICEKKLIQIYQTKSICRPTWQNRSRLFRHLDQHQVLIIKTIMNLEKWMGFFSEFTSWKEFSFCGQKTLETLLFSK